MRLFTVLVFLVSLTAPLYASDTAQEKPADSQSVVSEKVESNAKAEPVIKTEPDTNATMSEPVITPYKSNPVAVKAVEKNMFLFTDKIKERFSLWLSRSGKYLELMKEIIKSKNLPEDIVFLSLIESGFNPYAYSIARAVGPWQFISSTAKKYGLVIDWWRDERRDPVKSTEAAANYLKDLYEIFGSWNLAMAAYNAGEGKILRALNRSKSDDYWSLLTTRHIKRETKEYVPRFIAASMIAENPEEFGFKNIEYHQPLDYDEVTVNGPLDLEVAARCADTTIAVIKELNPELRRWCTPPDMSFYILRIPAGTKELFWENLADVPDEERFTLETYTVKKGDTIERIAKNTGATVRAILVLNSMDKIKPLKPGTQISLPPKEKFELDRDDRFEIRKASFKKSKKRRTVKAKNKKLLVTSLDKKKIVLND